MSEAHQDFLKAFLAAHLRLYNYTVSLVPCLSDADDVFQRTSAVLWEKWDRFDPERDFFLWACGIARIQAKRYLSEKGRTGETLGDAAALVVAETVQRSESLLDARLDALSSCIQRLPQEQQSLLRKCYSGGRTLHEIAADLRITPNALYLRLKRLRELLHACIDGTLTASQTG